MLKLQTPSLQLCQKNEPHYRYFSSNLSKEPLIQSRPQRKKVTILKLTEYYVTQSILFFISSRWSLYFEVMDCHFFTKQRRTVRLTLSAFDKSANDKRIHGNYRVKNTVERPVYNGWSVRRYPSPSLCALFAIFPYTLKRISCSLFSKGKINFTCIQNRRHGKT